MSDSDECPAGATPEQQFQHSHNLVTTAMRLKLEFFHIYHEYADGLRGDNYTTGNSS